MECSILYSHDTTAFPQHYVDGLALRDAQTRGIELQDSVTSGNARHGAAVVLGIE